MSAKRCAMCRAFQEDEDIVLWAQRGHQDAPSDRLGRKRLEEIRDTIPGPGTGVGGDGGLL